MPLSEVSQGAVHSFARGRPRRRIGVRRPCEEAAPLQDRAGVRRPGAGPYRRRTAPASENMWKGGPPGSAVFDGPFEEGKTHEQHKI
jgi:hypothetical protein